MVSPILSVSFNGVKHIHVTDNHQSYPEVFSSCTTEIHTHTSKTLPAPLAAHRNPHSAVCLSFAILGILYIFLLVTGLLHLV